MPLEFRGAACSFVLQTMLSPRAQPLRGRVSRARSKPQRLKTEPNNNLNVEYFVNVTV